MTSIVCEPLDEPGPTTRPHSDFWRLKNRCSTERVYLDECDVGLGVFANRLIACGEVILEIDGPLISFAETKRRGARECMALQIGVNRYIDTQPPGVFVNHSCEPNCGIRQNRFLAALRSIRAGEEIRYDYSTTMEEQSYTMDCLCGVPACRRVVRDFSTLPRPLRRKYIRQGIVMDFIVRRLGLGLGLELI
jgi:SET domain-containing protein